MADSFIGNVDNLCTKLLPAFTPIFAITYPVIPLKNPVISQSDLDDSEGPNLNSFLWCRLASVTR